MIFVGATDGQTFRAYHAFSLAFGIDADKSGGLFVQVAIIGFDKFFKCFGECFCLGHSNKINETYRFVIIFIIYIFYNNLYNHYTLLIYFFCLRLTKIA